jgi:hypothetical protein
VQECEGVFVYLDSRTATFKSPAFAEMRCKNTLLRTCNMLLKRLSKVRRRARADCLLGGRASAVAAGGRLLMRPGQGPCHRVAL